MRTGWNIGLSTVAAAAVATGSIAGVGCQSTQPNGPAFRPGAFSISQKTVLLPKKKPFPKGGLTLLPTVVVERDGHVEASVRFEGNTDCDFGLSLCQGDCPTTVLHGASGRGPVLTLAGDVPAGTYKLMLLPEADKAACTGTTRAASGPYDVKISVP
jgi:hypothetical protein